MKTSCRVVFVLLNAVSHLNGVSVWAGNCDGGFGAPAVVLVYHSGTCYMWKTEHAGKIQLEAHHYGLK